jgi:hypothetical protein
MMDTKMSAGAEGGYRFRCGARQWKVHALTQSPLDPVIGISVYIVDVYTRGKLDEEWLHGRNAKLCRGRAVLADNLVLAAAPLQCKPSASAFRIRLEAIERVRAPGEIGSCRVAELEDPGDGRGDWVDVSATRSVVAVRSGGTVRELRSRILQDRDPTPPPLLLRDGVVHCNQVEEPTAREPVFDEQTTARLQGLALTLRSTQAIGTAAAATSPRTGDTLRIDQAAYPWALSAGARASLSDDTQILSRDELEEALAAAPLLRARAEQPLDASAGTAVRTLVMTRARR